MAKVAERITVGQVWQHHSGDYYVITDVALNPNTAEVAIVYAPFGSLKSRYWCPKAEFLEKFKKRPSRAPTEKEIGRSAGGSDKPPRP